jgi:hypothetical protein
VTGIFFEDYPGGLFPRPDAFSGGWFDHMF